MAKKTITKVITKAPRNKTTTKTTTKVSTRNRKNRQNSGTQKRNNKNRKLKVSPISMLSHCARKYSLACSNPWHPGADGACVPKAPSRPSQKIKTFNRFTTTSKSDQPELVMFMMPCLANDLPSVLYSTMIGCTAGSNINLNFTPFTTGTVAPGKLLVDALIGVLWSEIKANSPYATSAFTYGPGAKLQVSGRMISAGLSYESSTNVNNLGGVVYMMSTPAHDDASLYPLDTLGQIAETAKRRMTNSKQWTVAAAIDEAEIAYTSPHFSTIQASQNVIDVYPFSNNYAGPAVLPLGTRPSTAPVVTTAAFTSAATSLGVNNVQIAKFTVSTAGTATNFYIGDKFAHNSNTWYVIGDSTNTDATATMGAAVTFTAAFTFYAWSPTANGAGPAGSITPASPVKAYGSPVGCPIAVAYYVNSAGTSATIEWEYIAHLEFVGSLTAALQSPSHNDPLGMYSVLAANARVPQLQAAFPNAPITKLHSMALSDAVSNNSFISQAMGSFAEGMGLSSHSIARGLGTMAGAALRGGIGRANAYDVTRELRALQL